MKLIYIAVIALIMFSLLIVICVKQETKKHVPVMTEAFYIPGETIVDSQRDLVYNGILNGKVILSNVSYYKGGNSIQRLLSVGSTTMFNGTSVLILDTDGDRVKLRVIK